MVKRSLTGLPLILLFMVACNLGQGVPAGNVTPSPEVLIPAELPTNTPGGPPPTTTPSAQAENAEAFGPVTVTGDFTTGSTVSIRVKRGEAVSGVNCLVTQQDTTQTTVLDPPNTTGPSLDGTFDETFAFSPAQGGSYNASCTGNALTVEGLQEVQASSSPFTIEAKG